MKMTLFQHEMKMNIKSLLIWAICVGGMCFGCILLFPSMKNSLQDASSAWANMGALSTAFGMDKMSFATLPGFYATEIGIMHSLGGAMFAALTGSVLISKEEAGHTAEFLNVFPIGRMKIFLEKYLALVSNILLFNIICILLYVIGFVCIGEDMDMKKFLLFHIMQLLMQIEIGSICFMLSAFTKRNMLGTGLGITIMFYAADMMCRIIPAIKNLKYVTPFYYSNATDIFSNQSIDAVMLIIGVVITIAAFAVTGQEYRTKDFS
jgi:ABC-2 type transport system permease protein